MKIRLFDDSIVKFVESLEKPAIAKVLRTIDLLEVFGHKLTMPHSKKVGENLFELRIRGRQEIRILYAFHKNEAVLLIGFVKKTGRIPSREIETANERIKRLDRI